MPRHRRLSEGRGEQGGVWGADGKVYVSAERMADLKLGADTSAGAGPMHQAWATESRASPL